jgi:large subunit ribosomal protein L25
MAEIRLAAQARTDFGKGAARRLRRDGQVPAVLYGDGAGPRHLSLNDHDLNQALKQPKVILEIDFEGDVIPTAPRDIQRDPVRHDLKHLDLITLDRAALRARQVEAEVMGKAEEVAVEKELDPVALSEIVSEMLGEGASPDTVIEAAVERLEAELKAQAEAAAAAAAAEDAAEASEAEGETLAAQSGGDEAAGDE